MFSKRVVALSFFLFLLGVVIFCLQILVFNPRFTYVEACVPIAVERDITYKTIGDISLKMDIYYPIASPGPMPTLVYVHGGGWYSGDKTTGIGQGDIPGFVSRGYVVASINYRLAPRYKFPAQIEDVKCAVRFLRANASTYRIDPMHIGAWGDSAGGHLAALLAVNANDAAFQDTAECFDHNNFSDRIQAACNMYGPTDLVAFSEKAKTQLVEHVFGTDDPADPVIRRASPISHVSEDDPPFLIIHGEKDDVVLLSQSVKLYRRLLTASVPVELMIVRNCGHCLVSVGGALYPTRAEITDRMASFFDKYLKQDYCRYPPPKQ